MTYTRAAFSHDGKMLATARHFERTVELWDTTRWQTVDVIEFPQDTWGKEVTFSPDGTMLAISYRDRSAELVTVRIWDLKRREPRCSLTLGSFVTSMAISPDDRKVVTGSRDGFARVWDLATGKELLKLKADSVQAVLMIWVTVSPSRGAVAAGGSDGIVRLWDIDSGELIETFPHEDAIVTLAYFPDGKLLAAGDPRGVVKIWRLGEKKPK